TPPHLHILSLHDALPIWGNRVIRHGRPQGSDRNRAILPRPAPPGATSSSPGRDEHQLVRLVRGVAGGTLSGYRDTDAAFRRPAGSDAPAHWPRPASPHWHRYLSTYPDDAG